MPPDFGDKCYKHIEELASYGLRAAELESESRTISYITSKLVESDIKVTIDTFTYKYFKYDSAIVKCNNERIKFSKLFINPYNEVYEIESEYFLLNTPIEKLEEKLNDRIIIASESYKFFDLFKINAKAIVVIKDSLYKELEKQSLNSKIFLKLFGKIERCKTCNLIGSPTPLINGQKDIIISAHWDSFRGPGADDNASGISVMIELAIYFRQIRNDIPFNIKYVAFGAEEMGLLGSQAYVWKHKDEFDNGILNINLDMIGGRRGISIALQNDSNMDSNGFEHLYASRDNDLRWILISPVLYRVMFSQTKQIDWIDTILSKVSKDSGIRYRYDSFDGDHCVLALSGIPSIGICVMGNKFHTPEDIPAQVNKTSLEKVAKLVTDLILNTKTTK